MLRVRRRVQPLDLGGDLGAQVYPCRATCPGSTWGQGCYWSGCDQFTPCVSSSCEFLPDCYPAPPVCGCDLQPCPTGQYRNNAGACVWGPESCPVGYALDRDGICKYLYEPAPPECPPGMARDYVTDQCVTLWPVPITCQSGFALDTATGQCVSVSCPTCPPPSSPCPAGQARNNSGQCVTVYPAPKTCPSGYALNTTTGACVSLSCPTCPPAPPIKLCPVGQALNTATNQCVPLEQLPSCPFGQLWDPVSEVCVWPPQEGEPPVPWFIALVGGAAAVAAAGFAVILATR